jgi:hypothetical protein
MLMFGLAIAISMGVAVLITVLFAIIRRVNRSS